MTCNKTQFSRVRYIVSGYVYMDVIVWWGSVWERVVWLSARLVVTVERWPTRRRLQLLCSSVPHHLWTSTTQRRVPSQRDVAVRLPALHVHGQLSPFTVPLLRHCMYFFIPFTLRTACGIFFSEYSCEHRISRSSGVDELYESTFTCLLTCAYLRYKTG